MTISSSSFIPPLSTRENAQKWYNQGYNLVDIIVNKRQALVDKIHEIIEKEIDLLNRESDTIRVTKERLNKILIVYLIS